MIRTRCIHFKGIQNLCAAGIDPLTVRSDKAPGAPMATFPCLDIGHPCATKCDKQRLMTQEELDNEYRKLIAAAEKAERDIQSGCCHICFVKVESRELVGRCEYARPCGHRIGQVSTVDEP